MKAMKVPLLDLACQNAPLQESISAELHRLIDSGQFILGSEVASFEKELAAQLRCKHAIGVSSGTDALLVALMALGVGPGDEVVTTAFSFFATAGVIARLGARPVFVDIDPATFHIDNAQAIAACGSKTKAVIPVHLFGRPSKRLEPGAPVIEDAAQSIGASALFGRAACLSFFPSKNLGAFGDAGAVITDDDDLADHVRLLRTHGGRPKYFHAVIGGNFRIDALQAAVLRVKLPHLPDWTQARRDNADRYRKLFAARPGIPPEFILPDDAPGHIYNQFVVRAPKRDALREHLAKAGISTAIYYPVPLHLQECFAALGYKPGSLPAAEAAGHEALAIPVYPGLRAEQQEYVTEQIAAFY